MGLKEIKRDYNSLIKLWTEITSKTIKSNAPCLIHEEDNIIKRSVQGKADTRQNTCPNTNNQITEQRFAYICTSIVLHCLHEQDILVA